jgi:hypothetical protein
MRIEFPHVGQKKTTYREHLKQLLLGDHKTLEPLLLLDSHVRQLLERRVVAVRDRSVARQQQAAAAEGMGLTGPQWPSRSRIHLREAVQCKGGSHSASRRPLRGCGPTSARRRACLQRSQPHECMTVWRTVPSGCSKSNNSRLHDFSRGRSRSQSSPSTYNDREKAERDENARTQPLR